MSKYEKLCKLLDITMQPHNYYYTGGVWHYPIFDEKKQIELIKLIFRYDGLNVQYSYAGGKYELILSENELLTFSSEDFSEALAGLILHLTETEAIKKEEVRRILE